MQATALSIRLISMAYVREHAQPLLRAHWEEIALDKTVPLDPDWQRYDAMEHAGVLFALGAFVDGKLVGYSINFIMPHLHYSGLVLCQNDVLFVARDQRGGVGRALMEETIAEAKRRGPSAAPDVERPRVKMAWHAKEGTALSALLGRRGSGYVVQDIIYSKDI